MNDQLLALVLFAFVSTFTPGPNNMMLMTSGANIGFARSIPHILGVALGFGLMVFLVGVGMSGVFTRFPIAHQVLQVLSVLFLLYLAVKIARSKPKLETQAYRPMTFFSAMLFQWVNPKGWSMALSAVSLYNPTASLWGLGVITVTFVLINIPCCSSWVYAGKKISQFLKHDHHVRWFNWSMASLLVASTLPMLG